MSLTIHEMSIELDAGPVLLKQYPISSETYIQDLYGFVEEQVPQLLLKLFPVLKTGR